MLRAKDCLSDPSQMLGSTIQEWSHYCSHPDFRFNPASTECLSSHWGHKNGFNTTIILNLSKA